MGFQVLYPRSKEEVDQIILEMQEASKRICASKETAKAFLLKYNLIKESDIKE